MSLGNVGEYWGVLVGLGTVGEYLGVLGVSSSCECVAEWVVALAS